MVFKHPLFDRFADVLGDVAGYESVVADKFHVDDETVSGDRSPSFREQVFTDEAPLDNDVQVGMPSVAIFGVTYFDDSCSAVLGLFPKWGLPQGTEGPDETGYLIGKGRIAVTKRQRDEPVMGPGNTIAER